MIFLSNAKNISSFVIRLPGCRHLIQTSPRPRFDLGCDEMECHLLWIFLVKEAWLPLLFPSQVQFGMEVK